MYTAARVTALHGLGGGGGMGTVGGAGAAGGFVFAYYTYIWRLSFFVRTEGNTYRLSYDPTPPPKSLAFGVGVKCDVLCMLRSGHTGRRGGNLWFGCPL